MRVAAITPFLVDKELPCTDEHRADAVSKAMHPSLHFPKYSRHEQTAERCTEHSCMKSTLKNPMKTMTCDH